MRGYMRGYCSFLYPEVYDFAMFLASDRLFGLENSACLPHGGSQFSPSSTRARLGAQGHRAEGSSKTKPTRFKRAFLKRPCSGRRYEFGAPGRMLRTEHRRYYIGAGIATRSKDATSN